MSETSMVERVANAIDAAMPSDANFDPVVVARVAISALREPTEAMVEAGWNAGSGQGCILEWQAMIDKALETSPKAD